MRAAIDRCLAHEGERRVGFEVPATLCRREAPLVVWTSHHYHDRLPQEVKRQLLVQRGEGRAIIKIPSDGWLLTGERVLADILSPAALAKLFVRLSSREGWLRWVFHFASSANSGDLDPLVALYDECASPRWNAQALYERVAALLPGELARGEGALKDDILSSPLQRRDFALRALFLPSITRRAIVEGEVGAWCSNIEEFARAGHAVLNAPGYRADLKNQVISPSVSQINASLALGCVGIIPLITEG
jgi:hypothetical protein